MAAYTDNDSYGPPRFGGYTIGDTFTDAAGVEFQYAGKGRWYPVGGGGGFTPDPTTGALLAGTEDGYTPSVSSDTPGVLGLCAPSSSATGVDGGYVAITGGTGAAEAGGGEVEIYGGAGPSDDLGWGGSVSLLGGADAYWPGTVTLKGGICTNTAGTPGDVSIDAGYCSTSGFTGTAAVLYLRGGFGGVGSASAGGHATLLGGAGGTLSGNGGPARVYGGAAAAGTGGTAEVHGGEPTLGSGGAVDIRGGNATDGVGGNGGSITIKGGTSVTGVDGSVALGQSTDRHAKNGGHVYIPFTTTTGTPSGTPTAVTNFAPMMVQNDAGTYKFWVYIPSVGWKSAALA